jgi:putative endonuclease
VHDTASHHVHPPAGRRPGGRVAGGGGGGGPRRRGGAGRGGDRPEPRRADARHALGELGERLAAAHLERLGYRTLERNVRGRRGEIDLIVFGRCALVFVEVKTRRIRHRAGPPRPEQEPLSWLHDAQCARVRRTAAAWLSQTSGSRPSARTIRFDAIGVLVDEHERLLRLDHVEGAW